MPIETPTRAGRPGSDVVVNGAGRLRSRLGRLVVMPDVVLAMGSHLTGDDSDVDQRSWAYGVIVRATESAYLCQM
jgi:hypothetical protein